MSELFKFVHNRYIVSEYNNFSKLEETVDELTGLKLVRGGRYNFEFKMEHSGEEEYLKHYGNPFAAPMHTRVSIIVTKTDDKVCIKIFGYHRYRNVGRKFFKVQTLVQYLTYNFKTNSLYTGSITNYHLKRKFRKKISRNSFNTDVYNRFKSIINNELSNILNRNPELIINKPLIINQVFDAFYNAIPNHEKYSNISLEYVLYKRYLDANNIKLSNNWAVFMLNQTQPTKKQNKKHKYKFIDTIMTLNGLKGDKIKKVLHNVSTFNGPGFLDSVFKLFGESYVMGKSDKIIQRLLETPAYPLHLSHKFQSKKERDNAFEILTLVLKGEIDVHTFCDHFRMMTQLRNFETFKWESNDYTSFSEEHYELSEKLGFYNHGDFNRIYNEDFVNGIETIIMDEYYPVVLKESKEYNRESFQQSNCVKGYVNRAESFIVSLRKGSNDSSERATIEYKIRMNNDKVVLKRVQTLGRFNRPLDLEWEEPIKLLDKQIDNLVSQELFDLPGVVLKTGNREFKSVGVFKQHPYADSVYLEWDDDRIINVKSRETNIIPNLDLLPLDGNLF